MERNSSVTNRITKDAKDIFDASFGVLQSQILQDRKIKISKEDFLEAVIRASNKISWKEIKDVLELAE